MGFIDIFFVAGAVILALAGLICKKQLQVVFMLASEACCAIFPITAVMDVNERMTKMDYSGIEDIYPSMIYVYIGAFIIVTLLNAVTAAKYISKG